MELKYIYSEQTWLEYLITATLFSLRPEFQDRKYDNKDTSVKYRTINHWETENILDDTRKTTGKGWRKFSEIDLAFLAIVSHLRDNGFPLTKIKTVKQNLFSYVYFSRKTNDKDIHTIILSPEKNDDMASHIVASLEGTDEKRVATHIRLMELVYVYLWYNKNDKLSLLNNLTRDVYKNSENGNLYLLIEDNGTTVIMTAKDLQMNIEQGTLPDSYYYINLNALFNKSFGDKFDIRKENISNLTEIDKAVFNALKDASVTKFTFDKKVSILTKDIIPPKDVPLQKSAPKYGKISITRHNGKVVDRIITITEKFSDKK